MRVQKLNDVKVYQTAALFTSMFSKAVQEAKEINRKNGFPNDFIVNGKRLYELPNGEITNGNPLARKQS